ncbi:hypothetical protein A5707_09230 [Mycobacterium kyorinense]|uniref:CDGP domain-containing protein n=2 Tax=Mycobacterium kyorinense TaxID=487514 RepID=A0A1A2YUI2_9MYCO|nr:hypothetical protein A5707_09230 [Mycobacterium kyorinense]
MLAAAGLVAIMAALTGTPHTAADPEPGPGVEDSTCATDASGILFCDGPLQADGTWTRCMTTPPQILHRRAVIPSMHRCEDYGPDNPPGAGQPPERIVAGG